MTTSFPDGEQDQLTVAANASLVLGSVWVKLYNSIIFAMPSQLAVVILRLGTTEGNRV